MLFEAGSPGLLPKDLALKLERFKVARHQISRRIMRMNKRIEKAFGEHIASREDGTGHLQVLWLRHGVKLKMITINNAWKCFWQNNARTKRYFIRFFSHYNLHTANGDLG